ncbi:FlgO family outer membrane protein [Desulfonatronovibrio magnus]|uniref:FlgO family outer membrane protein n=1 Tax=Desulfonatronovibrio magnus TaxID=698827 RepID=UPI00069843CE|nr:FlgO family outer membrane protein [Desulfonatronovibrio magnus]
MQKNNYMFCLLFMSVLLASGCNTSGTSQSQTGTGFNDRPDNEFTLVHEQAVDRLLGNCRFVIDEDKPFIVTSLVDIDHMGKSSTLGRMSSEIIAGRLAQHGLKVREVKMSQSQIFVSEDQGEFILSRNLQEIGARHDVQGFVVGTYAIGQYHRYDVDVYISLRFVNIDNIIACSENYVLPGTDPQLWQ